MSLFNILSKEFTKFIFSTVSFLRPLFMQLDFAFFPSSCYPLLPRRNNQLPRNWQERVTVSCGMTSKRSERTGKVGVKRKLRLIDCLLVRKERSALLFGISAGTLLEYVRDFQRMPIRFTQSGH